MKRHVLGFIFTPDYEQILLMRKNRSAWQVGLLNGVGGNIEPGESDVRAMVRESQEE